MKKFSLEEYLKNPERKIVTRDGHEARVICTDRNANDYIVIALVQDHLNENIYSYTKEGLLRCNTESPSDLFFAPEKKEGWINIYHYDGIGNANASRRIFNTKEEAIACANKGRVDTIKIEWEK